MVGAVTRCLSAQRALVDVGLRLLGVHQPGQPLAGRLDLLGPGRRGGLGVAGDPAGEQRRQLVAVQRPPGADRARLLVVEVGQPAGQVGPVAQLDQQPLQLEAAAQQQLQGERHLGGEGDALAQLLEPPGDGRGLGRVPAEVVGGPQVEGVGVDHQPQEDLEVLDELGVARVGAAQARLLARLAAPVGQQPLQQPPLGEHGLAELGAGGHGPTSSIGPARLNSINRR